MPDSTAVTTQRWRDRKAGRLPPLQWPICSGCGREHRGARGEYCSRCWEKLTPDGREAKAQRVRDSRARAKARALGQQGDDV
jgi:hypothetical protein